MYELAYGKLTKYWTTASTLAVMFFVLVVIFVFVTPSEIENPYVLLIFLLPIAYNIYSDIQNYKLLSTYKVSVEGVIFETKLIPWSSIDSYEKFGPMVKRCRQRTDIKLFSSSGVFIKADGKEYILYANANNYKKFIAQLSSNGINCENA